MGLIEKIKRMSPKVAFEYYNKCNFFNPLMSYWYALCPFLKQYGVSRHKAVLDYLSNSRGVNELIEKYNDYLPKEEKMITDDCPIWVMWWQGFDNCPPIVRKCIGSVKRNAGKHPIFMLDKDNFREYIDIPKDIEDKIQNKVKCIAYLSDIIRFGLLSTRGGIWLDATIYVSQPITSWPLSLYSICHATADPRYVLDGFRWSSFMVAAAPHEVMPTFVYKALLNYFTENDALIDYFLTDYLIATIYLNNKYVRKQIDTLPKDNLNCLELLMNLSKPYDKNRLDGMLKARKFHKLDWRHNITDENSMFAHLE